MLNALLRDSRALNLYRTRDGQWQASLEVSPGSWRVGISATPDDAIGELVLQQPVTKPPY